MIIVALLFAVAAMLATWSFLPDRLDPAERIGTAGVLGLGLLGLATWFIASLAGPSAAWGGGVLALAVCAARGRFLKDFNKNHKLNTAGWSQSLKITLLVFGMLTLVGVVTMLAPPTMSEWDTMAYHFAIPKLWLAQGNVAAIPFIHHSHFPYVVDSLFLLGFSLDSELAARFFTLAYFVYGAFAVFGFTRRRGGPDAGIWALLAYATIPVVLWEAGTGYVDGAHGLFVALGAAYAFEWCIGEALVAPWAFGALLGCAAGSKFTGLLTVGLVGLFVLVAGVRSSRGVLAAVWVLGLGFLVPMPWLVRNAMDTGNPVYPFFYSKLGGRGWDTWRAFVYEREQKSFGMGHEPTGVAASVLGLGYGPGRFTNPSPTQGSGFPFQGIGAAGLVGALAAWASLGRKSKFVGWAALFLALNFGAWFFLSQQSRYVSGLAMICALLAGLAAATSAPKLLTRGSIIVQFCLTLFGQYTLVTQDQLPAALGKTPRAESLASHVGLARNADAINTAVGSGKVALYDEVFGYFLNCKYMWGNPGHSMLIDHEGAMDGASYVASLQTNAITHLYVNFSYWDKDFTQRWVNAATQGTPFPADEQKQMMGDLDLKWKWLIADAAAKGLLKPAAPVKGAVLFEVAKP